jgi:hypothetical protein
MFTVTLFGAILWTWNAPCGNLEKAYFRAFFWVTAILETMRRIHALNQWSRAYLVTYWILVAFISGTWPVTLIYCRRALMFTTKLRCLLLAWIYMLVYYYGYFSDWHSSRLDWVPQTIYILAFFIFGLWARLETVVRVELRKTNSSDRRRSTQLLRALWE